MIRWRITVQNLNGPRNNVRPILFLAIGMWLATAALLLGLLVPAVMTIASCGKREDVKLAEFKDHVITIGEFEKAYANVDAKFLPKATGIDGNREFLNTMLNKEVMAFKADELGYEGRYDRLAQVLPDLCDIPFMAQKSVGRHWETATPSAR